LKSINIFEKFRKITLIYVALYLRNTGQGQLKRSQIHHSLCLQLEYPFILLRIQNTCIYCQSTHTQ